MKTYIPFLMALFFTLLTVTVAQAAPIQPISHLGNYGEHDVALKGVVAFIVNPREFTLIDNSGRIEVNLAHDHAELKNGQTVIIEGYFDSLLIDELHNAEIVAMIDMPNERILNALSVE